MTSFWSGWIIVLTLGSIAGYVWLLMANRKTDTAPNEVKHHVFDGIEEYDNPMPMWWFYLFLVCVGAALVHLALYPGLGSFKGLLNWTSTQQHEERVAAKEANFQKHVEGFMAISPEELSKDFKAVKMGERIFKSNCSVCHGSDARGSFAFPNLTDNDWLYGGDAVSIKKTITDGRIALMPAWGAQLGGDLDNMVTFVRNLSTDGMEGQKDNPMYNKFQQVCSSCHGADGKGMQATGAPNLTDGIWLYGGEHHDVKLTIQKGRNGQMPAHKDLLSEERIHLLTAFILSLNQSLE